MTTSSTPPDTGDTAAIQARTIRVLFAGVLPAGAGMTAGFASAALLGKEITGSGFWGTFAAAFLTIGSALATVPIASYMSVHGRRAGLRAAWILAGAGATCAFGAAILDFYPLLLVGIAGLGVGSAANLAARYAAADLAAEADRARSIGMLVWAGSFGAVLGPTLGLGWAGRGAEAIGLPELAGPYLMGMALFALSATYIDRRLRPDPLEVAGGLRPTADPSDLAPSFLQRVRNAGEPIGRIARHPAARLAAIAMLVGHAVMVGVMTATPLHMDDGDHELQIVGFVISLHIVGMYFFAPVVGWLVDRIGPKPIIAVGGVILFTGTELASHTDAEDSLGVFIGLFLVGLGWSFGLVSGSSLLTASFPVAERVPVQGAADLLMSGAGSIAALMAGVVYELASYHDLSHYAGFGAVALSALALWSIYRPGVEPPSSLSPST